MSAALICGVVALAFIAGEFAVRGGRPRAVTRISADRAVVSVAVGTVLLAPVFVLLAQLHGFSPTAIGTLGWIGLALWAFARRGTRWQWRVRVSDAVLAAAAIVFVVVAISGRDEPWGMGRDQQVYAEFAVLMASTGRATHEVTPGDAADAQLLRAIGADREVNRYLGITRTERGGAIVQASYLPLGWPAWLAFAFAVGGYSAMGAANAFVFVVGALLLHPVLRRSVGNALATAAVISLLALPSSLWIAGIPLSEPFGMLAWLATMAVFARHAQRAACLAPVMVFAASVVRIEALLLAPALIVGQCIDASLRSSQPWASPRRFAAGMVVALVAALAWYVAFQSSYLVYNIDQVVPIVAATLLAAALAGSESLGRLAGRVVTARAATAALAALVVALAVYGLFVRPVMQPFAAFHNGTGLDGTRDFREESLRNLAVYVGWPLLVIALGGAAITIARFARPAAPAAERALLITGFMYCLLYAWAPLVSPDHPWAIRRFVPVVMPMVVVLAAMALRYIGRRPGRRSVVAGFLMAGAAVEVAATSGVPMATMRENQGAAALMGAVDAALQEALVASDLPAANVAAVLSVARGRPIVVADFRQRITRTAVARWLEAKTREGKSAWLLSGERIPPTGVRMGVVDQWQFERRALARTTRPPARDAVNESVRLTLSRVDALDSNLAFEGFGGTPAWTIDDDGFFPPDQTPFGTLRMTNGSAMLDVPSRLLRDATALEFEWFSWAPWGETRETAVRIDGALAWHAALPPGVSRSMVALSRRPSGERIRITIESATFDARVLDPADYRGDVGIGLVAVRAKRGDVREQPHTSASPAEPPRAAHGR